MGYATHLVNVLRLPLEELKTWYHNYLQISRLQIWVISFKIEGVFVIDNELDLQNVHDSPKIENFPFKHNL